MSGREFKVGDGVVYRPYDGAPAEDGVVTGLSNDPSLVFVRYAKQHPGSPGQATPKVRLEQTIPDVPTCRECGCTDTAACWPTCWWVEDDLCSRCAS